MVALNLVSKGSQVDFMNPAIEIRSFTTLEDQARARYIFDQTWPMDAGTEITSNLLQAMVHSGAYLSGAFINGGCVGAALAFPAMSDGIHLHSHMAAVLIPYRDKGVGFALKRDQWKWAKAHGYPEITWTFDPLVSRNARLNMIKLGVDIKSYHCNFYGSMTDELNSGDESDRLMVSWRTDVSEAKSRDPIITIEPGSTLIQIPADIVEIRSKDPVLSMDWRRKVRKQFLEAFQGGQGVIGFTNKNEYVLHV